ncbi:MAG: stage III sporulation protein AE [Firmicutes bacterium]|nr:stage III sporulation protein AE [Bacillota bacterium]
MLRVIHISLIVAIMICFISFASVTFASPLVSPMEQVVKVQLEELDLKQLERTLSGLDADIQAQLPSLELGQLMRGGSGIEWGRLGRDLLAYLFREVVANSRLMVQLIVLAIVAAVLQNLQTAFVFSDTMDVSLASCLLLLIYIAVNSFQLAVAAGVGAIDTMTSLMYALLPLLSTTLAAVGGLTSAALMHPLLMTAVGMMGVLVQRVVFPLLQIAIVLAIVGNLFQGFPVRRLANLLERSGSLLLGTAFVAFAAMIIARGMLAPVADGVTIRAAKYLGGKIVPVLGNTFAQALDVAVGGSLLIKNALGMFGLCAILIIVTFPLVKIVALLLIFRVVTALVEPISDARLVSAMTSCGNVLAIVFVAVMTVALMLFLTITVMVGMGNLTATIR